MKHIIRQRYKERYETGAQGAGIVLGASDDLCHESFNKNLNFKPKKISTSSIASLLAGKSLPSYDFIVFLLISIFVTFFLARLDFI